MSEELKCPVCGREIKPRFSGAYKRFTATCNVFYHFTGPMKKTSLGAMKAAARELEKLKERKP